MDCLNCIKDRKLRLKLFWKQKWLTVLLTIVYGLIFLFIFALTASGSVLLTMSQLERKEFATLLYNVFGINFILMIIGLTIIWMSVVMFFVKYTEQLIWFIFNKIRKRVTKEVKNGNSIS